MFVINCLNFNQEVVNLSTVNYLATSPSSWLKKQETHVSLLQKKGKKKQVLNLLCSQEERRQACGEILSESVIETVDHKRQTHDKEARLAVVQVIIINIVILYEKIDHS